MNRFGPVRRLPSKNNGKFYLETFVNPKDICAASLWNSIESRVLGPGACNKEKTVGNLNRVKTYNWPMVLMHWLMVLGIWTAIGVGLYMVEIQGITPTKLKLYNWHKWLGVSLWMLVMLRLVVRGFSQKPDYPPHWGPGMIRGVKLGHALLYVLMIAVPSFGYLFSLAAGYPVVWFGVIELPVLIERNAELKELFQTLHKVSATTLMVVVIGHVLMAVKHHVIDRDRIFGRMIPGLRVD